MKNNLKGYSKIKMSDIEKAKQKLKSSGYVHPSSVNSSSNRSAYKTFNSESKSKDVYTSTGEVNNYATFAQKSQDILKSCPVCQEEALYACSCQFKDKACKNGHVWYINRKGEITKGDPHI